MQIGKIRNILIIREGWRKLKAEVMFKEESRYMQENKDWVILFSNELLVQVIPELNKKEILENQKKSCWNYIIFHKV